MNSKSIIAIVVVAIVVIACVGVGVFFATKNNDSGIEVDKLKEKIEVGDYETYDEIYTRTYLDPDMTSLGSFALGAYTDNSLSTGNTKSISYNGVKYECTEWERMDGSAAIMDWVVPTSGFVLEKDVTYPSGAKEVWILTDTTMNVELGQQSQLDKINDGAYYDYAVKDAKGNIVNEIRKTLDHYTKGADIVRVLVDDTTINTVTHKIVQIDGDTVTMDDGIVMSKLELLSDLSITDWVKYKESDGNTVTSASKVKEDGYETAFGKRNVTIETFDVIEKETGKVSSWTVVYGEKGVVYSETDEHHAEEEDMEITVTWINEKSSLIVKA